MGNSFKKFVVLALTVSAMALTACGKKDDNNNNQAAAPNPNAPCLQQPNQYGYPNGYNNNGYTNNANCNTNYYNQNGFQPYPYNQYNQYGQNGYYNNYGQNYYYNACPAGMAPISGPYGMGCVYVGGMNGQFNNWYYSGSMGMYSSCTLTIGCPNGATCQFIYGGTVGVCRY